ncbi:serine protease AprX [Quadrisphaera granulorum]|uniref:Serine protease AprX n=1 Tax=Quadrisphaera granulorum TaxID=317664 RepID=A0A316A7Q6_9ACTN|nr:S8 family serine peptidase [Quadrisphaera granulorum]PWJ53010.1 serine protease AprX [Quadrisphaera granulorum]SZE97175.1 serine protease AprX [Quadrisphaera granulorum]
MTTSQNRRSRRAALRRAVGLPVVVSTLVAAAGLATAAPALASTPGSPDLRATTSGSMDDGTMWGDHNCDLLSFSPSSRVYDPLRDPGSLYSITTAIGARDVWGQTDSRGQAITGKGVTVAVLDSGVAQIPGLNNVVQGPDLSIEGNSPQRFSTDTFGHGTHMASIIGANDPTWTSWTGTPQSSDGRAQLGVAPGAQLLALKLGNTDGTTDVSQVIAGIDWVVEHRRDNGMNVRVINLSYGTDSTQAYQSDPLAAAIERAWQRGIVVVASAGNEGKNSGGINDPAYDPYAIAVGSTSPNNSTLTQLVNTFTPLAWKAWQQPSSSDFSSRGTWSRTVDIAAPGKSVAGLRDYNSQIDRQHPEGRVYQDATGRLFRGSGTSQAAAVVSGAAALLLQANPNLTPDAVKAALTSTATPVYGADQRDVGAGQVNVKSALSVVQNAARGNWSAQNQISKRQTWQTSNGLGSLEAARGGANLVDPDNGAVLQGEIDVQGQRWDGRTWNYLASRDATWSGGIYMNNRWTGDRWSSGTQWQGSRWSGSRWSGSRWSSVQWDGSRWSGSRWSGSRWSGNNWS